MHSVKVTIRKLSGPRTALRFLSSYLVSLMGKSNLCCLEICQMGAACVHEEATFMVWPSWVWAEVLWPECQDPLLRGLGGLLTLGIIRLEKNSHLYPRILDHSVEWHRGHRVQERNIERETRRASTMFPMQGTLCDPCFTDKGTVQRSGQWQARMSVHIITGRWGHLLPVSKSHRSVFNWENFLGETWSQGVLNMECLA